MILRVFRSFATVALLLAASLAGASTGSELRGISLFANTEAAQVTLSLSATTAQRLFTLEHPRRVVVDLPNTRLRPGVRLPAHAGIITAVRLGRPSANTLRLVLELDAAVPAQSRWEAEGSSAELVVLCGTSPIQQATPKAVQAAHAPVDSNRDVVIAVDAGHGGQDPGASGPHGTHEKDVVLSIARALAARIAAEPGMRAVLTRNRDEFLVLRERIRRARLAQADMFVSIHADSIANHEISGASVYVLSERGASNEAARWLAERENAADLLGGVSLDDKDDTLRSVLLDLSQSANISASMSAAQRVLAALDNVGQVRKSAVQQAGFVVLKSPDIPSMLVETAYISNPREELRLRNLHQQGLLASAIFAGVRSYFEQNPPTGTRFAQTRRSSTLASATTARSAD
jgi:N-acetylmuramoyl-L-alanine amidase